MMQLAIRLFAGSDREGRLNFTLPVIAVAVATALMLLTVAAWQGFEARADRTSWIEPDEVEGEHIPADAFAIQSIESEWLDDGEATIVNVVKLAEHAPAPPGIDRFPAPGELWVSPALADLMYGPDPGAFSDRLDAEPSGIISVDAIAHEDQLVAVAGHDRSSPYAEPGSTAGYPDEGMMGTSWAPPTPVSSWSTEPTFGATTYKVLAGIGVVFMIVPLLALAGSASRLVAARRRQRLSQLRLVGGSVRQVLTLATAEAVMIAIAGAVIGAAIYSISLPLIRLIPIAGGGWFVSDVWVGMPVLFAVITGVVVLVAGSGLIALASGIRDPLGMARASNPSTVRVWRIGALAVAVAGFVMFGMSEATIALALGFVLVAFSVTGPWLVKIAGRLMALTARSPARMIAGRRLAEDPRAGWRSVAGMVLAGFLAGFVAVIPIDAIAYNPADEVFANDLRVGVTVVLISAFAVAAVSAGAGGIARVLDQRGPLTLLRLAGAPLKTLAKARRQEVFAPLMLFGGGSTFLGAALGGAAFMAAGGSPSSAGIALFGGLGAAGVAAVMLADRSSRPVLRRVTGDIAIRE